MSEALCEKQADDGDNSIDLKPMEKAFAYLKSQNSLSDAREGLQTFIIYVNNIVKHPAEMRYRRIRIENTNYQERLGHLRGGQKMLDNLGYVENGSGFLELPKEVHSPDDLSTIKAIQKLSYAVLDKTDEQFQNVPWYEPDNAWGCCLAASEGHDVGARQSMEDNFMHIDGFAGRKEQGFFAIYDGHGGKQTVDFLTCGFHINLAYYLKHNPGEQIQKVFEKVYQHTDAQIRRQQILQSGATAVTVLLRNEKIKDSGVTKRWIHCANVGDSRAVLSVKGEAHRLSKDHKATDPDEKKIIENSGGFVSRCDRVNGLLAVSRAFGDHMLKPPVSVKPYYSHHEINQDTLFLVLACDGLWDVMEDQEVVDYVAARVKEKLEGPIVPEVHKKKLQLLVNKIIDELIQKAIKKGSQDNISVLIVFF